MKTFRQFLAEDKEYTAIVRDRDTGDAHKITSTSKSLKQFKSDLRNNGYRVMNAASADSFGSPEWERKLYDNKEKRRQRKTHRIERAVDKIDYVHQKTDGLAARWRQLSAKMDEYELGTPEFRAAADASQKAYHEYEKAREQAEKEFDEQNKRK